MQVPVRTAPADAAAKVNVTAVVLVALAATATGAPDSIALAVQRGAAPNAFPNVAVQALGVPVPSVIVNDMSLPPIAGDVPQDESVGALPPEIR